MLTYALGRGLERFDRPVVNQIAKAVAENDYRFSALILQIAKSLPFQNIRLAKPAVESVAASDGRLR
jgi:hypothetical protein